MWLRRLICGHGSVGLRACCGMLRRMVRKPSGRVSFGPFRLGAGGFDRTRFAVVSAEELAEEACTPTWVGFVLVLPTMIAHLFCCAAGCHGTGTSSPKTASSSNKVHDTVLRVDTVRVERVPWPHIVRAQGSLVADEISQIGATVAGRVAIVHHDLGDAVEQGDPLVTLDQEEFRLQVAQAEAQLHEARAAVGLSPEMPLEMLDSAQSPPVREAKTVWEEAKLRLERAKGLRDAMAISTEEYEQAAAAEQVAAARYASALNSANERVAQIRVRAADLALAKRRLAEAVTSAPFRGFILQRHVAPGSFVQVGQPLVTLVRTDQLRFRGTLPERYAHQLQPGQRVMLHVEGFAEPIATEVSRISPSIDELSRSLMFESLVRNETAKLRSGLFAVAEVYLDSGATALVVPASAVTEFAGVEKVWTVRDGRATEQPVTTGRRWENLVEITDGLREGDWVVLDGEQGREGRVEPGSPTPPVASGEASPDSGERNDDDKANAATTGG